MQQVKEHIRLAHKQVITFQTEGRFGQPLRAGFRAGKPAIAVCLVANAAAFTNDR